MNQLLAFLAGILLCVGAVPLMGKGLCHFSTFWQAKSWAEVLDWGLYCFAASALAGVAAPIKEFFQPILKKSWSVIDVGETSRYSADNPRPTDREVYEIYLDRSLRKDGFRIPGIPVYFMADTKPFDVILQEDAPEFNDMTLIPAAASLGLDWLGFRGWRLSEKRREYYDWLWFPEPGIRCTGLRRSGEEITLSVTRCPWDDYICTELSVNLKGPTLPKDMRELFEGPAWTAKEIDVENLHEAGKRYSLIIGVSSLVTTKDGYLVLQRRSKHISEGTGGIGSTAQGGTRWRRDAGRLRVLGRRLTGKGKRSRSLLWAALRELEEEAHIQTRHLEISQFPFIGAAFNLLHGRDLNFYSHFHSSLSLEAVSKLRNRARDRWETAHLVFVDIKHLSDDGTLGGPSAWLDGDCNRHLRAALYSLARSGRLAEIRARLVR